MSRGDLQEMEASTTQSKTAVNANAKPGDPMPTMADPGTQLANVEDLGGPSPENYKPDDDSAKLKTPGNTIKSVKDVVNRGAKAAESMAKMKEESESEEDQTISEEEQEDADYEVELRIPAEAGGEAPQEKVLNVEEDVEALLAGEELSEEFRDKAKTIFEAALNARAKEIQEALDIQMQETISEEVELFKTELQERIDSYLEYVSQEWIDENTLQVEAGLKSEMTESFLEGMKSLFEEHYVHIDEDKYDVVESMVDKLDEMESKLNEQIERNISLNKRLAESVADVILSDVSEGLAVSQKEKLASLAENVEFESEENYRGKLETLKESYFSKKPVAQNDSELQSLSEATETVTSSDTMSAYMKALSMQVNK